MDNRVDDLNRDWRERLQNQNAKWKSGISELQKCGSTSKLTEAGISPDVTNPMWRTEQRLIEITNRLAPIKKMEQNLNEIMEVLKQDSYSSAVKNLGNENAHTAETQSVRNASTSNASNFYGVIEMTETYSTCLRNLERAIKSLEAIKQMTLLFGVCAEGISNVHDIDHTKNVLKEFIDKLKISVIS
uniref:Uncharacterized protein n=1 Tax=Setaria digitata TaxID=48799 RepID=A0A915Q2F5_9BILA